jgi:hypothetical protein
VRREAGEASGDNTVPDGAKPRRNEGGQPGNGIKRQEFTRGHCFDLFASATTLCLGVRCYCSSSNYLAIADYCNRSTLFLQRWNIQLNYADFFDTEISSIPRLECGNRESSIMAIERRSSQDSNRRIDDGYPPLTEKLMATGNP